MRLPDLPSNRLGQFRLGPEDFHRALKSLHGADSTKRLVMLSTSPFVVQNHKWICIVPGMDMPHFHDRMRYAVHRVGGASELARRVNDLYPDGRKISQQAVEYLMSGRPGKSGKPAQGSRDVLKYAKAAGVMPEWLASNVGPRDQPGWKLGPVEPAKNGKRGAEPLTIARSVRVKVKETGEKLNVELTSAALKVAMAFMNMSGEDRAEVMAVIDHKEAQRQVQQVKDPSRKSKVSNAKLENAGWAAPGTPTALRVAERKAKRITKKATRAPKPAPKNTH